MQRISQVGAMMANFGELLTTMSHAVEDEINTAIRDEQASAAEQLKRTVDDANAKITNLNATNESLSTQLLRSNQQLKVAADKLAELETEVLPLAAIDADDVFDKLEELDLVVGKPNGAGVKESRELIQKVCRDLEPLRARCSQETPAPKPAPKLADVAEAVGKASGAAVANVEGNAEPEMPVKA
jgi:hypothetical protein